MLPLHPFYTARKAKGTFYSGRLYSRKPSRPPYILYLPIKRSPQQQQVKEHSTQEKEHFTQG
nr:hypothetical protein [uncultured bacterium]